MPPNLKTRLLEEKKEMVITPNRAREIGRRLGMAGFSREDTDEIVDIMFDVLGEEIDAD